VASENTELLTSTYEAFGRGDIPAVLAVLAEDIVWNAPEVLPHAIPVGGRDDVAAFFQNIASTWDEFELGIDDVVAEGDRVCMIGHAGGTIDGTHKSYGFVHAWTVNDGVCVRFDEYVDPTGLG
jgi:ketosteroid isomerase-like protein